ncbi:MAG: hypothetical protein RAK22_01460, partial [Nanoarchaeota archaeon]|nr:hypothetical protein [Nanoarchaeota archaeon]
EKPSSLAFVSLDGKKILPSSIVFQDPLDLYVNGTLWSVPSSAPIIEKLTYDGFNLINHSLPVTSGQIKLNVSTLSLNVNIFSIPLSNAMVILRIGNRSVQNQTDFLGRVSFQNVPDTRYNVSVDVYGRNYEYQYLSGYENSIDVYPLIYQIYLMVGSIGVVILIFVFFESIRRRYIKGKV